MKLPPGSSSQMSKANFNVRKIPNYHCASMKTEQRKFAWHWLLQKLFLGLLKGKVLKRLKILFTIFILTRYHKNCFLSTTNRPNELKEADACFLLCSETVSGCNVENTSYMKLLTMSSNVFFGTLSMWMRVYVCVRLCVCRRERGKMEIMWVISPWDLNRDMVKQRWTCFKHVSLTSMMLRGELS